MAATKAKAKKLTATAKVKLMTELLLALQKKTYHYPESDFYEYCNGCGRSPYNVPDHAEDCLVVRVSRALIACGVKANKPYLR